MSKKLKQLQTGQPHSPRQETKLATPANLTMDETQAGEYLTTCEAAKMLSAAIGAVPNWRGRGPLCFRVPGARENLYSRAEVREFVRLDGRGTRPRKQDIGLCYDLRQSDLADRLKDNRQVYEDTTLDGEE